MSGKYTRKPRAEQINLFCRGATVFLLKANIRRSREQCKWTCIGMFHPEEPGGLGLTDTTGKTCDASRRACITEAWTVFLPGRANIAEAGSGVAWLARRGQAPGLYRGGGKVLRFNGKSVHFPQYNIALTDVIHENSWSSRKLLNLHKTL